MPNNNADMAAKIGTVLIERRIIQSIESSIIKIYDI